MIVYFFSSLDLKHVESPATTEDVNNNSTRHSFINRLVYCHTVEYVRN